LLLIDGQSDALKGDGIVKSKNLEKLRVRITVPYEAQNVVFAALVRDDKDERKDSHCTAVGYGFAGGPVQARLPPFWGLSMASMPRTAL
jgi:hypothetical protein